jgi:hypothetical protein
MFHKNGGLMLSCTCKTLREKFDVFGGNFVFMSSYLRKRRDL